MQKAWPQCAVSAKTWLGCSRSSVAEAAGKNKIIFDRRAFRAI
jgi:hypothetical protein